MRAQYIQENLDLLQIKNKLYLYFIILNYNYHEKKDKNK